MLSRNLFYHEIRMKMFILSVCILGAATACQSVIRTTTYEAPLSSPTSKQIRPTVEPSIPSTVDISTNNVSLEKLTPNLVKDLGWNADLGRFIYAYYDPTKPTIPAVWEAFDPVERTTTVYTPTQVISDDLKKQLGVFGDYIDLSPSGKSLIYLRVTENLTTEMSLSTYGSIEVWLADKDGLHSTRLGELPLLWDQVIWLDNANIALLTITYESVDSGIDAYSFDIENKTSQQLFASVGAIRGIPSSLSVSPDEEWIALTTYGQGEENGLWIVNRNLNFTRRVDSAYSGAQPLWSGDSRYLYYLHSRTTYFPGTVPSESPYVARYDIESQSIQPLTSTDDIGIPLISEWAVSGDGKHFLFEADSGLGYLDAGLWSLTLNSR